MDREFSLNESQKEKVSALREAFAACRDAGINFIVTDAGLSAFRNPGIQIARPYLGDDRPDGDAGEKDVTEELFLEALTVTDDFFYADDSDDVIFLSENLG